MKQSFIIMLAALGGLAFIKAVDSRLSKQKISNETIEAYKKKAIISCRPDLSSIDFNDEANTIPLLKGWGNYRMAVTVKNDSANIYFQQGINMYYGFHIIEALASFEKAARFDDNFAMAHWGKALAYGPNINDMGYSASPEALASVKKATSLYNNCSAIEKALIDAQAVRYSADSTQTREQLNQLYADAMEKVYRKFPANADAATLYADALMVQHPWDLYDRNYAPKPWTPKIVQVLEQVVKRFPNNPGAGHYYIHAVEGSAHPEQGLAVANRLGAMMPGLSHLVHMPSHIYIRSGHYNKGVEVNRTAVNDYNTYLSQYQPVVNAAFLYLMHNQHMEAACAMMDGQYSNALKVAEKLNTIVDNTMLDAGGYFGVFSQYVYLTPQFIRLRFGKWKEVLDQPAVPSSQVYATVLTHFARGVAFARTGHQADAANELTLLQDSISSAQLKESPPAFNPGIAGTMVAEKILQGVIAEEQKDLVQAIKIFTEAVELEDGMLYGEPRDWLLPARHYLAAVLIKAGRLPAAESVCKKDLLINPGNVWSLTALHTSLTKQDRLKEAAAVKGKLTKAAARTEQAITASVY